MNKTTRLLREFPGPWHWSNQLLFEVFEDQYRPLKLRTRSWKTVLTYRITLRHFEKFLERPATLGDLDDMTVNAFLDWRIKKVVKKTANRDRTNLKTLANWLANKRIIPQTLVDVDPFPEIKTIPKALNREEIDRLWKAIQEETEPIGRVEGRVFWSALFLTFWDTGERFSAVIGIRKCDIDFKAGRVVCIAKNRKGGKADRSYQLHSETLTYLAEILEQRLYLKESSRMFHTPFSTQYIWERYGRILERAGLPNNSKNKFHMIRRSTASHVKAAGGNATDQLGHSSTKMTNENYIDPNVAPPEQAATILFRPGKNDKAS